MLQLFNFVHGENIFFKETVLANVIYFYFYISESCIYIFEQNSSFVSSNVPIVKSTKVCYEEHLYFALFSYCTENEPNRDLKTKVRTEPRFLGTVTPLIVIALKF